MRMVDNLLLSLSLMMELSPPLVKSPGVGDVERKAGGAGVPPIFLAVAVARAVLMVLVRLLQT